jgi:outer membrane immunogenic protein
MRTVLCALAACAIAAPAFADDGGYWETTRTTIQVQPSQYHEDVAYAVPARPAPVWPARNWRGAYVGVNVQSNDGKTHYTNGNGSGDTFKDSGNGYGGTVGYTWQMGAITYGLEGDYNGLDNDGTDNNKLGQIDKVEGNWSASARGRVGIAIGRVMPYATAGWGWENHDYTITDQGLHRKFSETKTLNGPTIGGGIEVALTDNTSAKVEYRHTKLEDGQLFAPNLQNSSRDYTRDINTLMFGLNYRFAGPTGDYGRRPYYAAY